ncbi:MAG TPA: hypothetical protein ENH62_13850 [Marinobacter sp.]|uniref:Rho termination factor N-terminal domain-containing protein n=1 Tax=marine sediment metagenome TaxID=412755 RepID=A0A0F9VFS8_9ZZZZ|nr:hypothetical protein [Marinobacter sp.]
MTFPTRIGNLFINRLMPYEVCDEGVLEDLKRFEQSDHLGFEIIKSSRPEAPESLPQTINYSDYRINELRAIVAGRGVEGAFFMKKVDLIKKLEEKNGTSL